MRELKEASRGRNIYMAVVTRDSWKSVLRTALELLRELQKRGFGPMQFTMGGGTVLMFRFDHWLSRDIDLFIADVQQLSFISPRLNDQAASLVLDYVEQANSVKLSLSQGDIDFIIAAPALPGENASDVLDFEGFRVRLDSTAEIFGKKLLYRPETFRARDVFDLVASIEYDRASAARAVGAAASKVTVLERRFDELSRMTPDALLNEILVLDRGRPLLADMIARAWRFVAEEAVRPSR